MQQFVAVMFSLAVVLALIYVSVRLLKMLMKRFNFQGSSGGIEIIACRGLGADKSLAAVKAGEKVLLIGITAADIKVLAELSEKDEELLRLQTAEETPGGSFAEILAENFRKTAGNIRNDKKDGKQ